MDIEFADHLGDVPEDIKELVAGLAEALAPLFDLEADGLVVATSIDITQDDLDAMDEAWARLDGEHGWSPIPPSQWHRQPRVTVVPLT